MVAEVQISDILFREMLATHILTHSFQHTLFDLLKFTWEPPNLYGTHMIWCDHVNFNRSKRVCWKVCVKMCVASIPLSFIHF